MAIDRQHGYYVFICDECDDELDTNKSDFYEALEAIKTEGWVVKRNDDDTDWMHICNECASGRH